MKPLGAGMVLACCLLTGVLVALVVYQQGRYRALAQDAHSVCLDSNIAREQSNIRADVLVEFLRTAQQARNSATIDVSANHAAANEYAKLAARIHPISLRDCNDDGQPG